jgi:hypothetical protein
MRHVSDFGENLAESPSADDRWLLTDDSREQEASNCNEYCNEDYDAGDHRMMHTVPKYRSVRCELIPGEHQLMAVRVP